MTDFNEMLNMARDMQSKMADMQSKVENITAEGQAAGGMVKVTLSGKGTVKSVHIDADMFGQGADDKTIVEDLVAAAFNDAMTRLEATRAEEMQKVTGGLGLPTDMLKNLGL